MSLKKLARNARAKSDGIARERPQWTDVRTHLSPPPTVIEECFERSALKTYAEVCANA